MGSQIKYNNQFFEKKYFENKKRNHSDDEMSEEIPEGVVNLLEMIVRCYDC
jgi:coenzyme F420-reducing hydrogenase alpha subunit